MPTPLSLRRVAPDSVRNAVASMTGAPLVALIAWGLLGAPDATWTDWVWAAVLGGVQAPLLVGYATALFRAAAPQGYAP